MTPKNTFTPDRSEPQASAGASASQADAHGKSGAAHESKPLLSEKLRGVCVGLREDLEATRHVFRGEPAYILRDPMTFQSQRLDPADYAIIVRISNEKCLGEIFDELVAGGMLESNDEERFYEFVFSLHTLGFLRLPVVDNQSLYRRHLLREQAARREKLTSILFLRIPLWNPDAFLDRTMRLMRPLFSRPAFIVWCALIVAALFMVVRNRQDLLNPVHGLLVAENLPLMWVTLIVLKVFHEFGHAYACKQYGGHVPEMGVYLLLFTPCAYVDATASWGFTRKRERLIVGLAGMYVEGAIAACAVFVWAMTGPSTLNALAYNVMFLAGAVTVLFNINPLMRFDGYYILSDLLEIPNLRRRASQALSALGKRLLLGIETAPEPGGKRLYATLCTFGVCATMYRLFILMAITAILVSKVFFVGVFVGVALIGATVTSLIFRLTRYLWYAEETTHRRVRAVALSVVLLIIVPTAIMWLPLPASVQAGAVVRREHEHVLRARSPGFLERVFIEAGTLIDRDNPAIELRNDAAVERMIEAQARMAASDMRRDAYAVQNPAKAAEEAAAARALRKTLNESSARVDDLILRAPVRGTITDVVSARDVGLYFQEGDPLATVVAGAWQVRALVNADQMAGMRPQLGDAVAFRPRSAPGKTMAGRIVRIVPAGTRDIELDALTHLGGGELAVDPHSGSAPQAYFEIIIELNEPEPDVLCFGLTGQVRFGGTSEPIGVTVARRVMRFWNKLREG